MERYQAHDERRWRLQSLGESAICITEGSKPPDDTWVVPEAEVESLRQQLEGAVEALRAAQGAIAKQIDADGWLGPGIDEALDVIRDALKGR